MDRQTNDEMRQELAKLEAELDEAVEKYRQLKERIKACNDDESDEAFNLGLAEFNLFNYMDMLDEEIRELRRKLEAEN